MNEVKIISSNETKKIKKKTNLNYLWDQFDNEFISPKSTLECIYRQEGEREICDYCKKQLEISDEGFLTCKSENCGIIYKDSVDTSAEWRYYGADDNNNSDPTRCGMPINPLLKESSFGCKVICGTTCSYEMKKIRRYTEWQSMPYREKSQYDEFQRIQIIAHNAGLPKLIIDDAVRYHKNISEAKTFRGLNRDGIIAASIYVACRVNLYPRTAKEIASIFNLDNTSATKGCKNALSIINGLEFNMENNEKINLGKTTPSSFTDRYCSKLGINTELTNLCKFIAIRIEKNNLIPENTPHSIAAGIIYFISDICSLNISKKNISAISEISEVTINKCFKKLELQKETLIPIKILEKYKNNN
jgi:transcription initiation factor TFIIB